MTKPTDQDVAALVATAWFITRWEEEALTRDPAWAELMRKRGYEVRPLYDATALLASEARATALEAERDGLNAFLNGSIEAHLQTQARNEALEAQLARAREDERERCAAWHDVKAAHYDRQPYDETNKAGFHSDCAVAIRALVSTAPADGRGDQPSEIVELLAKVERLERSLGQRDRRIVRLLEAMDYARNRGIKFLGDEQIMTRGITAPPVADATPNDPPSEARAEAGGCDNGNA